MTKNQNENKIRPEISTSEQTEEKFTAKKDSGVGPIIGSIIIIILIVLGGLYFYGYVINKNKVEAPTIQEERAEQVNSDEIKDSELIEINNELNSADLETIDQNLESLDAEIEAAIQ